MLIQRPNSAVLCPHCTNLASLLVDISQTPKPGNAHTKWWDETYGKIRSIQGITPDTCQLCRILQRAFARIPGFNPADTKINISNRTLAKYKGLEHSACEFQACGARLALAPIIPVVKTDDGEDVHAFTGRFVLKFMNPLLTRNWMDRCEKHAGCRPDHSSKDFDFPFRLIDVQKGRLVEAPADSRYVALSYVWGSVKQVLLNKTTRKFLEQEGSISVSGLKEPQEEYTQLGKELEGRVIPRTIRDAILLCQLLNERYLWTDSLCILQDDDFQERNGAWTNADKLAQIPKMDIIYGASVLTVIAACGTDSNAGLPGVHISDTRTTQVVGKIGDQIFVSVAEDPLDEFWRSKWSERAWTFQEFLLSKRHLIFLSEQVVFHCSTISWSEDHSLEYVDDPETVMAVPAWTRSYRLRPLQLPDTSKLLPSNFVPALFINEYYNLWLKDFLKRQLTVTSDILFAFDGALSASNRHLGRFYHGLPVEYFCECLHWLVGLPWSWTGWMWDVASFEEFNTNYQRKTPAHWCRVGVWGTKVLTDGDVELWKISSPDVKGWERLEFFPSPAFQVDDEFIISEPQNSLEIVKKSSIPSNCLVIKTVTSFVYISSERQSKWSAALQTFSSTDFTPENLIGGIHFPNKWQDKIKDRLQVIITGSYFYGPDPRWPDKTDEMDPMIDCLVVEPVGDGQMERLISFVTRFSQVRKLVWAPIVAVLR
ncbi:HET-domain-containing protein [Rhizodiscina lignyota]|uniref:HET-domain-containing protein n=1 Tax=Rhizodiscina lignyota TaxID=1504668 RepID=A0A9P4MH41_9PEZI|nr:HET-domain-containing protein [Rhizodiscina lignyota]